MEVRVSVIKQQIENVILNNEKERNDFEEKILRVATSGEKESYNIEGKSYHITKNAPIDIFVCNEN